MVNNIIHGDALTEMKKLPDNSIDLLLTDPPYRVISGGKGGIDNRPSGILTKNDGKIFTHNDIEFSDWLPEAYRVLKPETHAYIFTNVLNLQNLLNEATKVGFQLHNLLVWEKNNCTPSRWYMKNAEYVLFLRKGKAKSIRHNGSKTVHPFDNILGDKLHPTQKPIDLLKLYILNSSDERDIVLDPFMGSGSTAVACIETGRNYIGFEMDETYYKVANERLAGVEKK